MLNWGVRLKTKGGSTFHPSRHKQRPTNRSIFVFIFYIDDDIFVLFMTPRVFLLR